MSAISVLKPPPLEAGDTVGIIAPASPLPDKEYLARGIRFWRNLGYQIQIANNVTLADNYLAGNDDRRLAGLHQMFSNPQIKALICLRGGYGSLRLLNCLDYELISRQPKILVGYSDITALHLACQQKTGLVTFHGPMLFPELGAQMLPPYTLTSFLRALTANSPLGTIGPAPGLPAPVTITPGQARGLIIGGNLSLVTSTLGTPFEIDTRSKILFLEEVDEAPYRLDRMLTQLKLAGKLKDAAAIAFGHCNCCVSPDDQPDALEVIANHLAPLGIPCCYGLPAGHLTAQATLPLGIRALLDADKGSLTYLEAATCLRE